jgi:hypothetical protein
LEARLFSSPAPSTAARPTPDWPHVHRELRGPHVTLMLLWLEYKETFPDGYAYSQFCEHYRRWRLHLDVVMRQEHKAGEKLFVDFPGRRIPIYDERLGVVAFEAELFVAVLGASSYLYAEAVRSQELLHWVTAHCHAFEAIGGCPAIVVCDNLRSGVTKAHRYEPDVNATYQEMAAHYNVAIIPARSYKPRDKACATDCTSWLDVWEDVVVIDIRSADSLGSDPSCRAPPGRVCAGSTRDAAVLLTLALSPPFGDRLGASSAGDRAYRFGRRVETLALVVVLNRSKLTARRPILHRLWVHAESVGHLAEGQHALPAQAIEATLEAVRLANLPDDPDGELIAHGRLMTGGVESLSDLRVGVAIE